MDLRKRSMVVAALFTVTSGLYGAARYWSPSLIFHVVEQSLIQKAPPGGDSAVLRERFRHYISSAPDKRSQMERLLRISEYLEKEQHPTAGQINNLIVLDESRKQGI